MPKYEKIVIDETVIINFIKVGRMDLLCELYSDRLYITSTIISDSPENIEDWIESGKIREAVFNYDISDIEILRKLPRSLADGEISCIIYGRKTNCAIATDDKLARKAIMELCDPEKLTGTIGLLQDMIQDGLITRHYARELLEEMIEKGFWYRGNIPF